MRCSDIFPATATMERCRTDGSRSPDCASFPAHHSWGLVFARQSGARSRQVLENGSDSVVEETTRQVLPTEAAREAIAALPKHHVEPGPLLRRAGISEHVLRSPKATQNTEFILGCFRTAFRALTGRNATPTTVAFSHNRNSDLREFERFFGCGVEFGANTNLLAYRRRPPDSPSQGRPETSPQWSLFVLTIWFTPTGSALLLPPPSIQPPSRLLKKRP